MLIFSSPSVGVNDCSYIRAGNCANGVTWIPMLTNLTLYIRAAWRPSALFASVSFLSGREFGELGELGEFAELCERRVGGFTF